MKSRVAFLSTLSLIAASLAVSACCTCPRARAKLPCDASAPSGTASRAIGGTPAPAVEGAPDGWVAIPGVTVTKQPEEAAWAGYSAAGYRTIVNFRPPAEGADRERDLVVANGMQYFNLPVVGTGISWGDADALAKILEGSGNRQILLHCSSGNRAAGVWALYQHRHKGLRPEAAIAEAQRVAPVKAKLVERLEIMLGLREPPCSKKKKKMKPEMAHGVQASGDSKSEDRSTAR